MCAVLATSRRWWPWWGAAGAGTVSRPAGDAPVVGRGLPHGDGGERDLGRDGPGPRRHRVHWLWAPGWQGTERSREEEGGLGGSAENPREAIP